MILPNIFIPKDERVHININTIYKGHYQFNYRGIQTWKCPMDYVIYQMLISQLLPDLVIEIGTHAGGTTLYIADLLSLMGGGIIHSIDIEDICDEKVKKHPRVTLFLDGWQNYGLEDIKNFNKILIIEDSAHTYENTIDVMKKFADIVSIGSYLVIEDGIINKLGMEKKFNGGPLKAINEFMRSRRDFIIDRKLCDFFGKNATFNVNGYLRKIT